MDIKRLQKLKADQEQRLKALCVRVDRLTSQEQQVWKDVAVTQRKSLQTQEKQWQRQAHEAERLRMERELMMQEQTLHERATAMRMRALQMKDVPRLQKFEENKAISRQVREDALRQAQAARTLQEQERQSKFMRVEMQRQQRRQMKLQKEIAASRREQARQDANIARYTELQEEIQNAELAIAVAEHEEISAVKRLQNSQTVRSEVAGQLQDIERRSSTNSPRSANEYIEDVGPPPQQQSIRSNGGYPRGAPSGAMERRSSPRQGASNSLGGMPTRSRLGGTRSSPGLSGRTDLGQISEEEACAMDSKAAVKKTVPGVRTRMAQTQRGNKQSPGRPLLANTAR